MMRSMCLIPEQGIDRQRPSHRSSSGKTTLRSVKGEVDDTDECLGFCALNFCAARFNCFEPVLGVGNDFHRGLEASDYPKE